MKHTDTTATTPLSVALIGPEERSRTLVAMALADTRRAVIREFNSYPPEPEHLQRLLASFDVVVLDLDSDPDMVLGLVEETGASDTAAIMVYSEKNDPKLAIRLMRAGAREYLLLPFERGAVAAALRRITDPQEGTRGIETFTGEKASGGLHVFLGSKGGSGVTTVACNVAIALAQRPEHSVLLIDLALPIGDCALCLGISAGYSTEDALRNIDRLDAAFFHNLLVKHRSGVYVLAAPTKVPDIEVSKSTIDKLIAIARQEFDYVIVDVGSRIDVAAKVLFEDASTIYLVTQTGISDLRNSNRLISQFFAEGNENLEIVINRSESRFLEAANEDVITKALGRPVRWRIPDDQDAARALQHGDGGLAETCTSRISLEMASSINGLPIPAETKWELDPIGLEKDAGMTASGIYEPMNADAFPADGTHSDPTITWPTPDPISYGNRLTFAQLNATASAEGTLVYTPGPGYVLPVGTHSLWVTFTPVDASGHAPQQASVTISVSKAAPAISWRPPAKVIYGTALDDVQLNASAPVPGKFDYSPAAGEMLPPGMHTLSVTFTPADTANYSPAQATVSLSVAKAKSAIHWPTPNAILYGMQLSGTQLCARASVPGSFEYKPDLGAALAAGEHELTVVFTPTDTLGYSISQSAVSLTVAKATPTITWPAPEPIAHDASLSPTQLNARATVPGTFAYTPAAGEKLAPGVHELSVIFTPADTLNYTTVSAMVPLTVTEKLRALINWPTPAAISYGTQLSAAQLNAMASVPGTFSYTPSAGHVLAPGRYTLCASFIPAEADKYTKAQATVELEVEGSPYASAPSSASEEPFSRVSPATGFSPADTIPAAGPNEFAAADIRPRETRTYKGAVYEKGEDGKWHLQKN
ncbi:MAG TPA: AAA family ATPase [Terracidiphilus sp.]|jgi:MinD-like ATPase involved in chromosome partitioning or flagellar assembly/CheY-like chemotaxis protein